MDIAQFVFLAIAVIVVFVLFLVFRAVVWWYFGIDKHLENQQTIIDLLGKQIAFQQIAEDQAARRRLESTQPASQSHQSQNPTRRPAPLQP